MISDAGNKEKWTNSGYILDVEIAGLADWLAVGEQVQGWCYEGRGGMKN